MDAASRGLIDNSEHPLDRSSLAVRAEEVFDVTLAGARAAWDRLHLVGLGVAAASGLLTIWLAGVGGSGRPEVLVAALATAVCAGVAFELAGRQRVGWAAIGLGTMLWACGNRAHPLWEAAQPGQDVSLGAIDVAALAGVVGFAVGILALLPMPSQRAARIRYAAEGMLIAASVLFASWLSVLPPVFATLDGRGIVDRVQLLAYPVGDVLLLGLVAFAGTKLFHRGNWSLLLLVGIGSISLMSSALSQVDVSDAAQIRVVDIAMICGFTAVLLAAGRAWRSPLDTDAPELPANARLFLMSAPGLSILIVVGTTVRQVAGNPVANELTWITIGVLTLSVLLHVTVIYENNALSTELALARDDALHASLLKSRFLANVSHEIRTPMNAVIGLTGLLLDTELEDDQRELAVGVATSAEGLLGLIDEVLDFSKIEAEKMDVEEIDLDLVDLIDDVAMIVGEPARRKGIELYAYCEPGLMTNRRGDPVRLRQVLLNLANNAVKFTHQGSVTIQAMPAQGEGPEMVAFLVVDTGVGIPEAEQRRVFEPFSQLDETTTRNFGGTGLGLGIVKGLVDLQGGTIEMASEVGVGTAFRITLPLPVGTQQDTERGLAALVGKRALVVDDNAVNRAVLAHSLTSWGFVVDQAASGDEALDRYAWSGATGRSYALALVEHRLDGLNGLELSQILRTQAPTKDAVILLLTSSVELSRQAARDAGIQSVLIKPVRNSYLMRRIVDALITQPSAGIPDASTPTNG